MRLIGKATLAGIAASCLLGLAIPGSASATANHSTDGPAVPADVQIYSNDEYVKIFGVQKAIAEGVPLPADVLSLGGRSVPPDPSIPWYRINWSALDWDYNDIPTRQGTSDFGARHAAEKHNMRGKKAINAPYNGKADRVRGTRAEYDGVVTSGGSVRMTITSVAERDDVGPGGSRTPDGRPIGTVTAFCRGQTLCPDWINNL
ncbi:MULTISPECIES: hypothetical protein [Streptomyces]|uniref:Secreted protein n=1 Tax=Streptomyces mashuensis TaxID=33904 RepID=A0A919B238_9ACTN|nr:hypothetical protein [Streptomyces mashuensis]GHF41758.1 hypothetical protein GCM10010218_23490 [Streptomyces mashuensis]